MSQVVIGMVGLGTIGTGIVKLLSGRNDLRLKSVAVRDPGINRDCPLPPGCSITGNAAELVNDPEIEVLVEVMGGDEPAFSFVRDAINERKHIVTANKELLAKHGPQLCELALNRGVNIFFEAAVAGGLPIISILSKQLKAYRVSTVYGILNGTTNFILTDMESGGASFDEALAHAQKLGLTEADTGKDIDGFDVCYKLSILSALICGHFAAPESIYRQGITGIGIDDTTAALQLGYKIKLIGIADTLNHSPESGADISLRVHPCLIPIFHPLASVSGCNNGILIESETAGQMFFTGAGAGQLPTASAVVNDLVTLVEALQLQDFSDYFHHQIKNSWAHVDIRDEWSSPFFLRAVVKDQTGVEEQIGTILKEHAVEISSIQFMSPVNQPRPANQPASNIVRDTSNTAVIIITHQTPLRNINSALTELAGCPGVVKVANCIPVLDRA